LHIAIDTQRAYSTLLFYLQAACIALIVFFFPLEFPSFHFETFVNMNNWLAGHRHQYHTMVISSYPTDLIVLGAALFSLHKWKKLLFTTPAKYLALFFFSALISTLYSPHGLSFGGAYKLFNCSIFVIFFSMIHYLLEEHTEKKIQIIFKAISIMMVVEAIFAITQYFTQAEVGWKMFERFPITDSSFHMATAELWRLDSLFSIKRVSTNIIRAYGTLSHTNILGGFLFFTSIFSYYGFYYAKKWQGELFYSALIFLNFFSICTTFSRASIYTFITASALWFSSFFLKQMTKYRNEKKLLKLAISITVTVLLCFFLFYPQFSDRGGIVNSNDFSKFSSTLPRLTSMGGTCKLILNYPLWGVGIENYHHHMGQFSLTLIVHNIYMLIASETGLIGLTLFILFLWTLLKNGIRNLTPMKVTVLATFIGLLLLGCVDFYLWRAPPGRWMFFLTAALLSALSTKEKQIEISTN